MPSVLISGASIAGPALAHWLAEHGWETTLVERFAELRDTGQNIDVRGAGREVLRRMGLEDAALAATTGETGTAFVDGRGRVVAEFPAATSDTDGATAELEILRGELSRLLNERVRDRTTTVFGDEITGLDDRGDRVGVSFAHAAAREFDLVVVAEGLTSRTRQLVMPDAAVSGLGLYMAYVTIPRTPADDDRWRWYNAGRGRAMTLRPDNAGTIRATLSFLGDVRGLEELAPADQALVMRRTFADAGWEAPRVLDALERAPFYFDAVGQMRLPSWSAGRVALVGDAAYCASPVSGMGTSLALVGAYVLAGELATAPDHRTAFEGYERRMRPYVARAQDLPPGTPRLAHPRSRAGVAALRTAVRIATSGPARRVGKLGGRLVSPPADTIDLPDYPVPAGAAVA